MVQLKEFNKSAGISMNKDDLKTRDEYKR